jgi:hypothetical protein
MLIKIKVDEKTKRVKKSEWIAETFAEERLVELLSDWLSEKEKIISIQLKDRDGEELDSVDMRVGWNSDFEELKGEV